VKSLPASVGKVDGVQLLGHEGQLHWEQTEQGLAVELPAERPTEFALALKITGLELANDQKD
jgi:hypothetical protein